VGPATTDRRLDNQVLGRLGQIHRVFRLMEACRVLCGHDLRCVERDAGLRPRRLAHIQERLWHILRQLPLTMLLIV